MSSIFIHEIQSRFIISLYLIKISLKFSSIDDKSVTRCVNKISRSAAYSFNNKSYGNIRRVIKRIIDSRVSHLCIDIYDIQSPS